MIGKKEIEPGKEKNQNNETVNTNQIAVQPEMSQIVGNLEAFEAHASIIEYLERFENFADLNQVREGVDKTKWLLVYAGPILYSKIKSACSPANPNSVAYLTLKPQLLKLLAPKNIEVLERAKFNLRDQNAGETASEYALALRSLAEFCQFGNGLDGALRDRFVIGLRSSNARSMILKSGKTTFDQVVAEAQTIELANESRTLGNRQQDDINKVGWQQRSGKKSSYTPSNNKNQKPCGRCLRNFHPGGPKNCPALNWTCKACGKKGHIKPKCRTTANKADKIRSVEEAGNVLEHLRLGKLSKYDSINSLNAITATKPPELVTIDINGVRFQGEIDTGACIGVLSSLDFQKHFKNFKLHPVKGKQFKMANGQMCNALGTIKIILNKKFPTEALVIESQSQFYPLIGRTWLDQMSPTWREFFKHNLEVHKARSINQIHTKNEKLIEDIKKTFSKAFEPANEPIKSFQVHLTLKAETRPRFLKASSVPYALKDAVSQQLMKMEADGIIERKRISDWGSQIVIAPKKNGGIRICCNYKPTLNPALEDDIYPLPLIDDILGTLNGNKLFTTLDLTGAYWQLSLDEDSQKLTAINTHLGVFVFKRLPYGVKVAPSIFQSIMEQILQGLEGIVVYFDDILIPGKTLEECVQKVHAVLSRLIEFNVQVNYSKCKFFENEIEYLGHVVSSDGIAPCKSKVNALLNAQAPKDVLSLKSFLGLINFYSKFLPNLQSSLYPLHLLTKKNEKFIWSKDCQEVFEKCKIMIAKSPILAHYDPKKPLSVVCDASPYGVGAILQVLEQGVERPVFMVSSTLSPAEKNYAQIHREALAIVFGVQRFHKYIYGHKVTVYTDCKALEPLLNGTKCLSTIMNSRFLRWILFLQNYDIVVKYRPSAKTVNADALSCLPENRPTEVEETSIKLLNPIFVLSNVETQQLTLEIIAKEMVKHKGCEELIKSIQTGWPDSKKVPDQLKEFSNLLMFLLFFVGCKFDLSFLLL